MLPFMQCDVRDCAANDAGAMGAQPHRSVAGGDRMAEKARKSEEQGTRKVVYVALAANALIALAKLGAGMLVGSSSMLAEGAHSIGDTANEVFLLVSLNLADDAPDEDHPFGHGKDRFFWTFLAAVFIFFAGAVFSFYEGITKILSHASEDSGFLPAYIVLLIAFVMEGISFFVSTREVRRTAREEGRTFRDELRLTRNTTVKLPVLEDSAALLGLVFAAAGLALTQVTGSAVYDGLGSIAIGVLLTVLAWVIGSDSRSLLLGESMVPEDRRQVKEAIMSFPEVVRIYRMLTMHLGPNAVLVTADINVQDNLSTDQIEDLLERVTQKIQRAVPEATQIFLELHGDTAARTRRTG